MTPTTIRLAEEKDIRAITQIYNQAIEARFQTADLDPVTEESRRTWLLEKHDPSTLPVWVVEVNQTVVGWCSLSAHRGGRRALQHTAEISYYLDPAFLRRGLGTKMVHFALEACPGLGIEVLFAILLDENKASVALLEHMGFSQWGHLPGVARIEGKTCGQFIYGRAV